MFTDKIKWIFLVVLLLLTGVVISLNNQIKTYKERISHLQIENGEFVTIIDDNGQKIAEQEQIILTQKDAIDLHLLEIERLKEVESQVSVVTQTIIDSVYVPFNNDSIPTFSINDKWYGMSGIVENKGLVFDSLYFNNDLKITIGQKSNGLFKKTTPMVVVTNENPYSQVVSLQNVVIEENTPFWERKGFLIGLGFIGGIVIYGNMVK